MRTDRGPQKNFYVARGVSLCFCWLLFVLAVPSLAQDSSPDPQRLRPEQVPPGGVAPAGLERVYLRIAEIQRLAQRWRMDPVPAQSRVGPLFGEVSGRGGATRAELEAAEERLRQLISDLLAGRVSPYRRDGVVYIPLQYAIHTWSTVPSGSLQTRVDTIRLPPDTSRLTSDSIPTPREPPRVVRDTLFRERVERIEQQLLDRGVFRAFEVNFAFGSSTLEPRATRTLDAVGSVLERYPEFVVEIVGHTDAIGSAQFNQWLSRARAVAVRRYLLNAFDLERVRLIVRGYGEERPVASNESAAGRALNRRVEFRVLRRDGPGG